MKPSADAVQASYRFCRRMCRQANSNFAFSFLLLPRSKRRAMTALYAFMRLTDDLVDSQEPGQLRSEALLKWRALLENTFLGHADPCEDHRQQLDRPQIPSEKTGRSLLPALADTIQRFAIPAEHLRAVIDGVEMDLARRRYETFEELERYCERVASAVGLACLHVWGFHGQPALEPARKCGIALQLTNILRDLKDDARADRVYLPLADLRQCRYSVDDLKHGVVDQRFKRLMQLEVDRAEMFFREGAELLGWLEPDGQRIFGMMMATYHVLLKKIRRRPHDVFARRICVGRLKKLRIAARWTLLPPRPAALR